MVHRGRMADHLAPRVEAVHTCPGLDTQDSRQVLGSYAVVVQMVDSIHRCLAGSLRNYHNLAGVGSRLAPVENHLVQWDNRLGSHVVDSLAVGLDRARLPVVVHTLDNHLGDIHLDL